MSRVVKRRRRGKKSIERKEKLPQREKEKREIARVGLESKRLRDNKAKRVSASAWAADHEHEHENEKIRGY